jgi:iron complex outermembrane receptor protein
VTTCGVTAFDPEVATSFELGARTEFFDRRLRINPTFYYQYVEDLQLLSGSGDNQFVTATPGT